MIKSLNDYFRDWESSFLGFGYGSGEAYTTPLIRKFMENVPLDDSYDYTALEKELTPQVAWLLINLFCKNGMIEYGASPRFGWLSRKGKYLKDFMKEKSDEQLINMLDHDENYIECYPDHCNCDTSCHNPFWKDKP